MDVEFHVDSVSGKPLPVLIVRGWCTDRSNVDVKLECTDGSVCGPALLCREHRPDVDAVKKLNFLWTGFIAEFHLVAKPATVRLFGKSIEVPEGDRYGTVEPHYKQLYETDQVLHRDHIYCVGPPTPANPIIIDLAMALLGKSILDFGCGTGDLVARLRAAGRDATGIEIDRSAIREHMSTEAAPFLKLYDGSLPLPYADQSFDSAIATEVIEHVRDPVAVTGELMRVSRKSIFITVPDMSSIPFSWPTNTVPWHLLEASHVNFFNARSLSALFAPRFTPAKYLRLYNNMISGQFVPGSIAILFARA